MLVPVTHLCSVPHPSVPTGNGSPLSHDALPFVTSCMKQHVTLVLLCLGYYN